MILTASNLRRIFQTLYGYRWAEVAAERLGVTLKTIRRWTKPGGHAPACRRQQIIKLLAAQIAALERMRDDLV